jgi:hypothetical protein
MARSTFVNSSSGLQRLNTYTQDGVLHTALITSGYQPNIFDESLNGDYSAWCGILRAGGLEKLCLPLGQKPYKDRPWITQPDGGRAFSPQALALVSSITPGTSTTVLSIETPFGYDGVINYVIANILPTASGATNFTEGSGDITWNLTANGRHLRDWGQVLINRGSAIDPSPIPNGGLRIYSRNLIQMNVTLAIGNSLNPNSNLLAMIMGWFYPR